MRLVLILLFAAVTGCSSLPQFPAATDWSRAEWPQFGCNPGRTQHSASAMRPPLSLAWTRSASGGQGTGSPIATGGSLFVPGINGNIDVFDLLTGDERGTIPAHGWLKGTPVILDSAMIFPSASTGFSLNAMHLPSMTERWENEVGMIESPLLAVDGHVIAGTSTGDLFCLAAADSAVLWRSNGSSAISCPAAASDGLIFYGNAGGDLSACNAADGKAVWRHATGAPFVAGPVAGKGWVFGVNRSGLAVCLSTADGAVRWTRALGAMVHASPAADDSLVYVPMADGALTALSLRDGSIRWVSRFETVLGTSPLLTGASVICIAMNGHIALIDAATGAVQWETRLAARCKTSPIIAGGLLIVCTEDRKILAFRSGALP